MNFMPLDSLVIISSALAVILYGFSVLMFIGAIWAFTYKCCIRDVNRPMATVATLMFILSTANTVLVIINVQDGLVKYRDTFPGGPAAFFADLLQEIIIAKNVIFTLQTLLGDGVVVDLSMLRRLAIYPGYHPTMHAMVWYCSLWYLLGLRTEDSGLVAYRIWTIERKVSTIRVVKRNIPILRVLVDAAILYSAALCPFIITFSSGWPGVFYVMGDLLVPTISITFYMVFIRIAISKHTQNGGTSKTEPRTKLQYTAFAEWIEAE
ncbi:hypothetical protein EDB19DRAFT_815497 [Suillus lakei]|nr:hypothetical protein EDB19DRAFT_815497 [Suillus lakei]